MFHRRNTFNWYEETSPNVIFQGRPGLNRDTGLGIPAVILQLHGVTWSRRVMWNQRPLVATPWRRQRDSAENSGTFSTIIWLCVQNLSSETQCYYYVLLRKMRFLSVYLYSLYKYFSTPVFVLWYYNSPFRLMCPSIIYAASETCPIDFSEVLTLRIDLCVTSCFFGQFFVSPLGKRLWYNVKKKSV